MSAIKLKPISYMVLGMLRLGAKSGYAIKKAADASTSAFWPTSLAQVYPELARLERHGLVTRHEDPHGARARSAYVLTEEGEAALRAWLRSPVEMPLQVRSEAMLRLFFADALPREDQLALMRRVREHSRDAKERIHNQERRPALDDLDVARIRYPPIVGQIGEGYYDSIVERLTQLEAEIEAEQSSD